MFNHASHAVGFAGISTQKLQDGELDDPGNQLMEIPKAYEVEIYTRMPLEQTIMGITEA